MRKVFIDTNVLIDFLGRIVSRADRKEIELMVSSLSYATASYILMRYNPRPSSPHTIFQSCAHKSEIVTYEQDEA